MDLTDARSIPLQYHKKLIRGEKYLRERLNEMMMIQTFKGLRENEKVEQVRGRGREKRKIRG